jgi:hypothetical protein
MIKMSNNIEYIEIERLIIKYSKKIEILEKTNDELIRFSSPKSKLVYGNMRAINAYSNLVNELRYIMEG